MGTSSKNVFSKHEEILIEDLPGGERLKMVRPERFDGNGLDCRLEISNLNLEILNYSAFGIATVIDQKVEIPEKELTGVFKINDIAIQALSLKLAYRTQLSDHTEKIAFEIMNRPLDIECAASIFEAIELSRTIISKQDYDNQFSPDFRRAVLETRDFLQSLKLALSEHERGWKSLPPEAQRSHIIGTGKVISQLLKSELSKHYEAIALSMENIREKEKLEYFNFFRNKISELILEAPFASRAYSKPLGYSGDFEMMNLIYRDEFEGETLFAKCLHKYYVEQSAAKAVKNRAHFLEKKIEEIVNVKKAGDTVRILSLACGPATEIQSFLKSANHSEVNTEITLIDQDLRALQHAQHRIREQCLKYNIQNSRIIYHHTAIKNIIINGTGANNHFDLIYSAGLFDYLSDPVAIACMKQLHVALKPGGTMIIGNFDVFPNRPHMEMALDWHLIVRTSEDLLRLASELNGHAQIEFENEKINLFLKLTKPF